MRVIGRALSSGLNMGIVVVGITLMIEQAILAFHHQSNAIELSNHRVMI